MVHERRHVLLSTAMYVKDNLWPVLGAILVFYLAYASPVSYTGYDPRPSLLVSQAILEHHTIRLDAYRDLSQFDVSEWSIKTEDGHLYYYWPVGPSILAGPFVWTLNSLGKDMSILQANDWAQNLLSAILCALVFVVIYQICRCYLRPAASLVIASVSVLGSGLLSTMGTALWNIDFTTLFMALSLLLICRFERGRDEHLNPYALGSLLFGAFFCRPTAATFIAVILVYLLLRSKGTLFKTAVTAGTFLALFVLWTWLEYGRLLPPYYSAARFSMYPLPAWLALYAHLFSPSRGLLVFSPFFALVLLLAVGLCHWLKKHPVFWIGIVWLGLHLAISTNAARWWGGYSFGPRLDTEISLALILITILAWHELSLRAGLQVQIVIAAGYLFLGLAAIWINVGQGLYNPHTVMWNGASLAPDIDKHPNYLLDWRYPQFLATNRALCDRNYEHMRTYDSADLDAYRLGSQITYASGLDEIPHATQQSAQAAAVAARGQDRDQGGPSLTQAMLDPHTYPAASTDHRVFLPWVARGSQWKENVLFIGWTKAENGFRWTTCRSSSIVFRMENADTVRPLAMDLLAGSFGAQEITVHVNGARIGTLYLRGDPTFHSLPFSGTLLAQDGANIIEFRMPDAAFPDNPRDPRLLGLQFLTLRIYAPP